MNQVTILLIGGPNDGEQVIATYGVPYVSTHSESELCKRWRLFGRISIHESDFKINIYRKSKYNPLIYVYN